MRRRRTGSGGSPRLGDFALWKGSASEFERFKVREVGEEGCLACGGGEFVAVLSGRAFESVWSFGPERVAVCLGSGEELVIWTLPRKSV